MTTGANAASAATAAGPLTATACLGQDHSRVRFASQSIAHGAVEPMGQELSFRWDVDRGHREDPPSPFGACMTLSHALLDGGVLHRGAGSLFVSLDLEVLQGSVADALCAPLFVIQLPASLPVNPATTRRIAQLHARGYRFALADLGGVDDPRWSWAPFATYAKLQVSQQPSSNWAGWLARAECARMQVIADGLKEPQDYLRLRRLGVQFFQGALIHPVQEESVRALPCCDLQVLHKLNRLVEHGASRDTLAMVGATDPALVIRLLMLQRIYVGAGEGGSKVQRTGTFAGMSGAMAAPPIAHAIAHPLAHSVLHPASYPQGHPGGHATVHLGTHQVAHGGMHPSTHAGTHPAMHPGAHPSTHPAMHPGTHPSAHSAMHPGTHPSTHSAMHQGTHPSAHSAMHQGTHPSTHPATHPGTQPSAHPASQPSAHPSTLRSTHTTLPAASQFAVHSAAPTATSFAFQGEVHPTAHPATSPRVQPSAHWPTPPSAAGFAPGGTGRPWLSPSAWPPLTLAEVLESLPYGVIAGWIRILRYSSFDPDESGRAWSTSVREQMYNFRARLIGARMCATPQELEARVFSLYRRLCSRETWSVPPASSLAPVGREFSDESQSPPTF